MVELAPFRRDLFYRVNVMTVKRAAATGADRRHPMLARHFLQQYAADFNKNGQRHPP
jgi:transcriptional regulator with PAS, ATPase and Fis domain